MELDEIFDKTKVNINALIPYGFKNENGLFVYHKRFMNNAFEAIITVDQKGHISNKVIDLSFDEEYMSIHRNKNVGEYVHTVQEVYKQILLDIKEHCCIDLFFMSEQANRITYSILEQYGDLPDYPWDTSPDDGIFRNPDNKKWYGLIMHIPRKKLTEGEEYVNVLNVKLKKDLIPSLIEKEGIYPSYHMNKKYWVSIILDDTLSDEEIMSYIKMSHAFTDSSSIWLIPANPAYYEMEHCFEISRTMMWKQSKGMKKGDTIYIYVTKPIGAILYACQIIESDIPYTYNDSHLHMQKVMKIQCIKKYPKDLYTYDTLKKHGITSIRGPRHISKELIQSMSR